jgi:uncharacterized phage-associated protein
VVATHLLNLVDRDSGEAITHLKLQKLVYYCQAWYLANFDTPLFEEDFQAWAHGPVARSVYDRFKGNQWAALEASGKSRLPSEYHDFVAAVYDEYGQFGAKKLEKMTHEEAPWRDVRGSLPPEARCEDIIPKIEIRNFYAKILGKKPLKKL